MKLSVKKYYDADWVFVYPRELYSEDTMEQYEKALECLGYDDHIAEELFKSLIKKHPLYIDAYNHLSLAFRNQNKRFESALTAEKACAIGKACFPATWKPGKDKLSWLSLENRPYLRACHIHALECLFNGDTAKAMDLFDEMLALNEGDNQGIRFQKLELLFAQQNFKAAKKLISRHSDEFSIEFAYGQVAMAVIESDIPAATALLQQAIRVNAHFVAEMKKTKHTAPPPHRIPGMPDLGGVISGSVQQAYEYWESNKDLYQRKDIIEFYRNVSTK